MQPIDDIVQRLNRLRVRLGTRMRARVRVRVYAKAYLQQRGKIWIYQEDANMAHAIHLMYTLIYFEEWTMNGT
jgi:hypothetical protein